MANITTLSEALESTIKKSELQDVTINIAEVIGDSLLKDGILKDIPVLSTIIGFGKGYIGIKDALFTKKLIYFLKELSNISAEKRFEEINKIESSKEYKVNVGEKLLFIIDKSEDTQKAEITGKLFCAFLEQKISYDEFLKCNKAVENLYIKDISKFLEIENKKFSTTFAENFVNVGLMTIINKHPKMIDTGSARGIGQVFGRNSTPNFANHEFKPGELYAKINDLGLSLKRALA